MPDYLATIGFEQGAREIVGWHDEHSSRRQIDARLDAVMGKLIATYLPTTSCHTGHRGSTSPATSAGSLSPL